MNTRNHIYTPILVAVILVLILLSKLIDASVLDRENEYVAVMLLECIIFAIPCIIFSRFFVQQPVNTLKISVFGAGMIPLAALGAVILISGGLLYGILSASINITSPSAFTLYEVFTAKKTDSVGGGIYLAFAYALIPSVFEEFVFRGVVCTKYEKLSPIYSVLMSSLMFGFIHFDLRMLPFHIFAGIILSVSMYASHSIFIPITIHFLYNLFFVFFPTYISAVYSSDSRFFIFVCGMIFFIALAFFCAECRSIYKKRAESEPVDSYPMKKQGSGINVIEVILSPSAVVCYLIYFAAVLL